MNSPESTLSRAARWLAFGSAVTILFSIAASQTLFSLVYEAHAAENLSYRELRLLAYAALLDELGHAEEGLVDELSRIFQDSRSTLIEP